MQLSIHTKEKVLYTGPVCSIDLPSEPKGPFQLLPMHADLVAVLGPGVLRYRTLQQELHTIQVTNGMVEVLNGEVTVLLHS